MNSITVDHSDIIAVDHARNLGVIFDKRMMMDKQVNHMCKKAYFNIRNIAKIRKILSKDDTKTVVNALVTPHLDYGNGLLFGINKRLQSKLQVAQNSAVRVIEKLRKRDHISQYRKNLHWLPIPARIEYKILTTTWIIKLLHTYLNYSEFRRMSIQLDITTVTYWKYNSYQVVQKLQNVLSVTLHRPYGINLVKR